MSTASRASPPGPGHRPPASPPGPGHRPPALLRPGIRGAVRGMGAHAWVALSPPGGRGEEEGGGGEQRGDPPHRPMPRVPLPRGRAPAGAGGGEGDGGAKSRRVGECSANGPFFHLFFHLFYHLFFHLVSESVPAKALPRSA